MSKIVITSKTNVKYTLEFDRRSAEIAERSLGISLTDLLNGKITYFPPLFQAAFLKHHKNIKPAVVQELFEQCEDKNELYQALVTMYTECVSTLVEEPTEGNAISWKME